ncbi:ABC transporter permease [Telmatospirillum sp. J64-1]|uniref:ABC transporter permease n=1 Tax=Telmatospirillum sp. J64-1 TaxID=2502183 RepID=UPI001C8F45C5|nr:ABC transporter permease [Telmatospirillum sp. J64-1]
MNARIAAFFREFSESRIALVSLGITLFFVACTVLAPFISPINPYDLRSIRLSDARLPPGTQQVEPVPELSIPLAARDGKARAEGVTPAGDPIVLQLVPDSDGRLALEIDARNMVVTEIRLRGLPIDASVQGARKHPIRSEWTLANPASTLHIETGPQIPANLQFSVLIKGESEGTGMTFLLGTDGYGRDMLSAIIYGIRISMIVGAAGALGAMAIGTFLGLIAAWFGGRVDSFIMRLVDFQLSIPSLMVGLLVLTMLGKGVDRIILAIILIQWTYFARTTRSVALAELRKDYVDAARCLRFSALRINLLHILPNCLPPLLVILTISIAGAITLEASLSFLGVGLPLTQPSLGMLIANGYEYMFSNMHWIAIYPGLVLLVMIVAINVVGDRLRDMFNPQLKR